LAAEAGFLAANWSLEGRAGGRLTPRREPPRASEAVQGFIFRKQDCGETETFLKFQILNLFL